MIGQHAEIIRDGRSAGYPLCCVVFFTFVFLPLWRVVWWARGTPSSPATGLRKRLRGLLYWLLFAVWATGRSHVLCPWHRAMYRDEAGHDGER